MSDKKQGETRERVLNKRWLSQKEKSHKILRFFREVKRLEGILNESVAGIQVEQIKLVIKSLQQEIKKIEENG